MRVFSKRITECFPIALNFLFFILLVAVLLEAPFPVSLSHQTCPSRCSKIDLFSLSLADADDEQFQASLSCFVVFPFSYKVKTTVLFPGFSV